MLSQCAQQAHNMRQLVAGQQAAVRPCHRLSALPARNRSLQSGLSHSTARNAPRPCQPLPHASADAAQSVAEVSKKADLPPTEGAKFIAEFTAQALFNFLSCTTALTATFLAGGSALQSTMLVVGSHAVILTLIVFIFANTSGAHFNPIVTLGMVLTGRQSVKSGAGYVAAQLLGGVLGAWLAYFCLPSAMEASAMAGLAAIPAGRSVAQALVSEIVGSFLFISSLFGLLVDPRGWGSKLGGFSVPLSICLLFILCGPISGNCLNPARAFGPALVTGMWDSHWAYWFGPLLGGGSAALLYNKFFMPHSA